MDIMKLQAQIEAMLFASGKEVNIKQLMNILELSQKEVEEIIDALKQKYSQSNSGIELIRVNDNFQLVSKKEFYEYILPLIDNRTKPSLSNAALETLSIIAYNPRISKAQIEAIRGVNSDGTMYKLLELELIEAVGKLDVPGKPTAYSVTNEFYKVFGISSLDELPELPKFKIDENEQIVIDEIMEENNN